MEDLNLVFKIALEDLGLNPDEYRFELTRDIPALDINALGTACKTDRKIWLKENLSWKEIIKIMLHEIKHLEQMKIKGWHLPGDKKKMEEDADLYAVKNVIRFQLIARCGIKKVDLRSILSGIKFYKEIEGRKDEK